MPARWVSIGGALTSAPAICSRELFRLDVFGRGTDNALWQRTRVEHDWEEWTSLAAA